jgi:hypothetical protein
MTCCIELEVKHKDEHFAKKKQQLILETVTEKGNPSGMYRKLKEAYHNKNHVK